MEETSEFILFLGRFHPLILHLPIGFLVIAFMLECLARLKTKYHVLKPAIGIVLIAGVVTAIIAAILGLFLSQGGGYNEDLLNLHKWLGIGSVVVALLAYVLYWQKERNFTPGLDKAYFSTFTLSILVLMGAGHYGRVAHPRLRLPDPVYAAAHAVAGGACLPGNSLCLPIRGTLKKR